MGETKDKAKRTRTRKRAIKASRMKKTSRTIKLYDAKKFEGTAPAFAHVTMEEMRTWRDDR